MIGTRISRQARTRLLKLSDRTEGGKTRFELEMAGRLNYQRA